MALKKLITTDYGIDCADCYIIAKKIVAYKDQLATCEFWFFKDQSARIADKAPVKKLEISFTFDLEVDKNILKQAYLALKSMQEYSDSVDV